MCSYTNTNGVAATNRRMSLPPTPMGPLGGAIGSTGASRGPTLFGARPTEKRQLPVLRHNHSMGSLVLQQPPNSYRSRSSHPDIYSNLEQNYSIVNNPGPSSYYGHYNNYTPPTTSIPSVNSSPIYLRRVLPTPSPAARGGIARKLLKRCTNPDLMRFQRTTEIRDQSIGRGSCEPAVVDPVYLALKQATGRYSRRGSNFDSATPSPRNLSQVSLQDSGYVEIGTSKANPLLGSTPQLDNAGRSVGRRRAPKLSQQMKSLSLDCQDMPPRINSATRSPLRSKLVPKDYRGKSNTVGGSSDFSDAERSCSPVVKSRRSSSSAQHSGGYIVIHEYTPGHGGTLTLGEKVHVVDNGDPDWLHGFRYNDRTEHMITFPATCVAQVQSGEQAMRVLQNVLVAERKLRMYRDQIVFVQPDSLSDGKVTVRTEHNAYAPCPLSSLAMM